MKKLFYSFVILSVVLLALFTIGQLSTAQNKIESNTESENQKGLQKTNLPQTGAFTNGFTHTGVIQIGGTDTWTIDAAFNDSITVRIGKVTGSGGDPNLSKSAIKASEQTFIRKRTECERQGDLQ